MANLFKQIARRERQEFFWRLDAQWGKGLRQKTGSDHCPLRSYNPAEPKVLATVTSLPRTHLVKPTNEHSLFAATERVPVDFAPNSGLHFVRGLVERPSPCTLPVQGDLSLTFERAPRRVVFDSVHGQWVTEWL